MKPVENWKDAWRWHSTQALTILALAPLVWEVLPPELVEMLPAEWMPFVLTAVALGGLVGRLRAQS
jgi:hypothetical protein